MTRPDSPPAVRDWLGLTAVSLGVALIVVDLTIVNVILAPIIEDLSITSIQAQWVQESYAIVFAALLLLVGRLSDVYGARRLFVIGLVIFGVTSLAAAMAPNGELLIAARFAQGVGGAMILPTSLALVNSTFSGKFRAQAFAVWGSTIGAAAAVGPLIGGWLADFSWRWAFGINIPLVALIMAGALIYLRPPTRTHGHIDIAGAAISVFGLAMLTLALIEGRQYGWFVTTKPLEIFGFSWSSGPSPVLVAFLIAVVALVVFWRRQAALIRRGEDPLMDVRLLSLSSFRNGNVVTILVGVGEFGIIAVLPLWFQFTLGYSGLQAGLALVALAVGSFVASGASFSMAASVTPLNMVRIGLVLEVVGLLLLGWVAAADTPWWWIVIGLFIYGIGVGFATAQVTNVVLSDVPASSSGQASGIQSMARELGAALGIAIITTIFFTTLASDLSDRLLGTGLPPQDAQQLGGAVTESAGALIPQLAADPAGQAAAAAARDAMSSATALAAYFCAAVLLLGLLATLTLKQSAATAPEATVKAAD
jgi:EmrB/QacA subfamily drug resistance transporter